MSLTKHLDKLFQTFRIFRSPLFVANTQELQVEGSRMSHIRTNFSPSSRNITIGKFNQIQCILYIRIKFGQADLLVGIILILAYQSAVQNRQRFGAYILRQLEILKEAQSVSLEIIGEETMLERIMPAVFIQRTILYRTYCFFPFVTGSLIRTFYNTAAGKTENTGFDII